MFSCGGGGGTVSDSGATKVTISLGQSKLASFMNNLVGRSSSAIPSNVASIRIVISGPGMDTIDQSFDVAGRTEIVESFEVPNGTDRHFLAIATDASGKSLFQGDATAADLNGTSVDLTIEMGFDIAGDWTLNIGQSAAFATFAQTGNSLTFTVTPGGSTASARVGAAITQFSGSGSIIGANIQLSATGTDCGNATNVTITGTVSNDGISINGNFTQTGGCGNESGTVTGVKGHVVPQFDVTGAWSISHTPQGGTMKGPDFFNMTQTGNSVTFTYKHSDGSSHSGSGSVSGGDIQLVITDNTDRCNNLAPATLTGTISADGNTMNGTYTVPGTSGDCANGETGTWTGTKAQPPAFDISGGWSGFQTPNGGSEQGPLCITFTQTGSYITFSGDFAGSGILSGSNIFLQYSIPGGPNCLIVYNLAGTTDGNTASGTYTTSSDCGIPPGAGTWRAVKGTLCAVPTGTISGTVTDTLSSPINGVSVTTSLNGNTIATATTASDGTYFMTVPAGNGYSVSFSKFGFITSTTGPDISVTANTTTTVNAVLSAVLSSGQVRIVLTWNGILGPDLFLDLDSYLNGPAAPGDSIGSFWTWYGSKTYAFGNTTYAQLDHDWITSADGPVAQETTTIYQQVPGTYTFYVNDFTNTGGVESTNSTALATSSAQVTVYIGSNAPVTFNVPNQPGGLWTVFTLNGSTLTPINTISTDVTPILPASSGSVAASSVTKSSIKKKGSKKR